MKKTVEHDLSAYIRRLTIHSMLSHVELKAVMALPTKRIEVAARRDILGVDEETDHSCFIASGLVARFGQLSNGDRQTTAFHIPGDMADLHSAVRPMGIGGLNALTDSVILRIPHDAIKDLTVRYPALTRALWRDCMLDTAILMEWVVNIGRRDAERRVSHLFCEMALRYEVQLQPSLNYELPVTQEQLADAVGITGVHLNRVLRRIREAGLASFANGKVQIHNWADQSSFGDFDPTYLGAPAPASRLRENVAAIANG